MADEFFQYDAARVISTWGGKPIQGFAKGTFIKVEFDEDQVTKTVGAQGAVTATVSNNRAGKATFTLVQGSPTNDVLSKASAANQAPGQALVVKPLMIKDLNGTTLCSGDAAWVKKVADTEFGDEQGNRQWVLDIAKLIMNTGGAVK